MSRKLFLKIGLVTALVLATGIAAVGPRTGAQSSLTLSAEAAVDLDRLARVFVVLLLSVFAVLAAALFPGEEDHRRIQGSCREALVVPPLRTLKATGILLTRRIKEGLHRIAEALAAWSRVLW